MASYPGDSPRWDPPLSYWNDHMLHMLRDDLQNRLREVDEQIYQYELQRYAPWRAEVSSNRFRDEMIWGDREAENSASQYTRMRDQMRMAREEQMRTIRWAPTPVIPTAATAFQWPEVTAADIATSDAIVADAEAAAGTEAP